MNRPTHLRLAARLCAAALVALGCPATSAQSPATPPDAPADPVDVDAEGPASAARPKLVVVIVIDQMRAEMLDRFGPQWRAGLAELTTQGLVYLDAHHDHASTLTAPGHASIATGTYPRKHGVPANEWRDEAGREHYAATDPNATSLIPGGLDGGPADLQRDTLGDWLRAHEPDARVWALAMKDRAAIMMGGKHPSGVIWWDVPSALHNSSDYYFDELPGWVTAFDATLSRDPAATGAWEADPTQPAIASHEDDFAGEGPNASFPHRLEEHKKGIGDWLRYQPRGDARTLELALELIDAQQLGRDDTPDLLWIGLSSGDWIGHRFGPNSHEIELYYRAMDIALGDFFAALRARGLDPLIVVTADHGVADVPQDAARRGRDARRFEPAKDLQALAARLKNSSACPDPKLEISADRHVDVHTPALRDAQRDTCVRAVAQALLEFDWCVAAFAGPDLRRAGGRSDGDAASPTFELFARSFVPGRSADVLVQLAPGYLFERGYKTGSAHGSPYPYDTHVPLVFMGSGLGAARVTRHVALVDLAPTLARVLGLPRKADLDGQALEEVTARFAADPSDTDADEP